MFKILYNLEKKINKATLIILLMFVFSVIYLLIPDEDFSGVNNIKELIKNELLKKKVIDDINKNTNIIESFGDLNNSYKMENNSLVNKVEELEEEVKIEYKPEKVEIGFFEKYFSRLYFSIVTGCLLGYGDVYPITIRSKILVMLQSLITIIVIVS